MSNLKHLTLKELKEAKGDCNQYIVKLQKKNKRNKSTILGQQERLKWINKYIDDKQVELTYCGSAPWEVVYDKYGLTHIENRFGQYVCDLSFYDENAFPQHEGFIGHENNCHLIAAAPQLLEMLEQLTNVTAKMLSKQNVITYEITHKTLAKLIDSQKLINKVKGTTDEK